MNVHGWVVYIVHFTVYYVHYTIYFVQCNFYSVQGTVYFVYCKMSIVQHIQCRASNDPLLDNDVIGMRWMGDTNMRRWPLGGIIQTHLLIFGFDLYYNSKTINRIIMKGSLFHVVFLLYSTATISRTPGVHSMSVAGWVIRR